MSCALVDFQGVFENLDEALSYDAATRDFAAQDRENLFEEFKEQLERVFDIFDGVPRKTAREMIIGPSWRADLPISLGLPLAG